MVCSGHHISLRLLSLLRVMNISPSPKKKKKKKKRKNFFEVVIVASCNEYLSLPKKKNKKKKRRETSKPSWMHFVEEGKSLYLAQLDLQEASTEACSTSPGSGSTRVCPYRLLRPVQLVPLGCARPPSYKGGFDWSPLGECVPHASVSDLPSEELRPDDSSTPPSTRCLQQSKLHS